MVKQSVTGIFKDDKGQISSMRVMSFIALMTAVGLAVASVCGAEIELGLITNFTLAAFGGKFGQKAMERR